MASQYPSLPERANCAFYQHARDMVSPIVSVSDRLNGELPISYSCTIIVIRCDSSAQFADFKSRQAISQSKPPDSHPIGLVPTCGNSRMAAPDRSLRSCEKIELISQ